MTTWRERLASYRSTIPVGEEGDWKVEHMEVDEQGAAFHNLREVIGSGGLGRMIEVGTYTRLKRGMTTVMSDTPAELEDIRTLLWAADCYPGPWLINGLGLGCTVEVLLQHENVPWLVVVEQAPEVLHLVGTHLQEKWGERLKLVEGDALTCPTVMPGQRFAGVWHDIWDHICTDNLPDMKRLHRRYGTRCDWQGSWSRHLLE